MEIKDLGNGIIEVDGKEYVKSIWEKRQNQTKEEIDQELEEYNILKIKDWFLNKEFNDFEKQGYYKSNSKIIKETDKAIQVEFDSKYGKFTKWIPKSCIE